MKRIVLVLSCLALAGCGSSSSSSSSGGGDGPSISVVSGESFCIPSGVDDLYTGDGHVTFYVTVRNDGTGDGTAEITPIRHYDDGQLNESAMDMVSVDVPAGSVKKFRTDPMKYKAHEHEISDCALQMDGNEIPIGLR